MLFLYIMSFTLFDIMPYEPNGFIIDFDHRLIELLVIDFLKLLLGFCGSSLVLLFIYKTSNFIYKTSVWKHMSQWGRRTLDIYLLNIIVIEMIGGPLYRIIVLKYNFNIFHEYGLLFEFVSTFLCTCFMMLIIMIIDQLICSSRLLTKVLFYRDIHRYASKNA